MGMRRPFTIVSLKPRPTAKMNYKSQAIPNNVLQECSVAISSLSPSFHVSQTKQSNNGQVIAEYFFRQYRKLAGGKKDQVFGHLIST